MKYTGEGAPGSDSQLLSISYELGASDLRSLALRFLICKSEIMIVKAKWWSSQNTSCSCDNAHSHLQVGEAAQRGWLVSDPLLISHRIRGSRLDSLVTEVYTPSSVRCHGEKWLLYAACSMFCAKIYKDRQKNSSVSFFLPQKQSR